MKERFRVDIQLFAEEGTTEATTEVMTEGATTEGTTEQPKSDVITKEMLDLEVQRAGDKVRSEYVKKMKDLERANMTEEAKRESILKEKEEALERDRQELTRAKLINVATDELIANGISPSFKEVILGTNEETTKENVKKLKESFDVAVQNAVNERFKSLGMTVPAGQGQGQGKMTADEISKLTDEQYYQAKKNGRI